MENIKNMPKAKKKSLWKRIKVNWMLYLFVVPGVLWYLIFCYVPLYGVQIAFQDYRVGDLFGQSEWVGFKHFIRFFESAWFGTLMKNTLTLSLLSILLGFPAPIIIALLLNEVRNSKIRKTVQTVIYAPHFISLVVLCGMITMFLSPSTGLIGMTVNSIRTSMGLGEINILTMGSAFKWVYVLSGVWQATGWGSIIYFAALSGSDPQILEAAKIDGASKLQCIWHINIPVLIPTITIQLILRCGSILGVGYQKVYLLQNDSILRSSEVISTYVYRAGIQGGQYSFSAAVGLFNSLINALMLIIVNLIVRKIDSDNSLW